MFCGSNPHAGGTDANRQKGHAIASAGNMFATNEVATTHRLGTGDAVKIGTRNLCVEDTGEATAANVSTTTRRTKMEPPPPTSCTEEMWIGFRVRDTDKKPVANSYGRNTDGCGPPLVHPHFPYRPEPGSLYTYKSVSTHLYPICDRPNL